MVELDCFQCCFLLGLLHKRLEEEPNCKIAKEIQKQIIKEFPMILKMLEVEK